MLATLLDLALVVIACGLIIFFHELGHFLAARWAGIRVLAFALGFGPAAFSYRKGLGLRRGSTWPEYARRVADGSAADLSPTEYRLNYLPFGGYVRMLGQDDLDPSAVSSAPDSYQNCKPWKRMIVISAGVIANLIIAAVLFVIVFSAGLPTEPAKIGAIVPGSAASHAVALNADTLGLDRPGLLPGDRIIAIDGETPDSFQDLVLASAMARPNKPIALTVERAGVPAPLDFSIMPERGPLSGMLELGIEPTSSTLIREIPPTPAARANWERLTARLGLTGLEPGMRLVSVAVNGQPPVQAETAQAVIEAARAGDGSPITLTFEGADRPTIPLTIQPVGEFERADTDPDPKVALVLDHVAGLAPVMRVGEVPDGSPAHGLKAGDVFVRLGSTEFPSIAQGIAEIRAHRNRQIPVIVERTDESGAIVRVTLNPRVSKEGTIGFNVSDTADLDARVALPPATLRPIAAGSDRWVSPAAHGVIVRPGSRVVSVNGAETPTLADVRAALVAAARIAPSSPAPLEIPIVVEAPLTRADGSRPSETLTLTLSPDERARIAALSWGPEFVVAALFEPEQITLKADNPLHALRMGISETHRWMLMTYATFARLFQGSVKVEHLKGPVGIAHIGTLVASQGLIKLLFFLGLVSVNLAVVNFLPLPIVDGGQFLFLLFEQIRGKPVPIPVQNFATLAGLVLIGCMFLIVTFNDIRGLF